MKPSVIMIAGPNGAGKTTAAMALLPDFLRMREFVNADEIARGLSPLNASAVSIEAGSLMLKRLHTLIEQRKHFAFETTGAGQGHIRTLEGIKMFFTHYVPLADKVEVYDNTYGDTRLVADNCLDKSWRVHQPIVWKDIQEKINER